MQSLSGRRWIRGKDSCDYVLPELEGQQDRIPGIHDGDEWVNDKEEERLWKKGCLLPLKRMDPSGQECSVENQST